MQGARGVIINVTGGPDLTLAEVSEASDIIYSAAHEDANIIFGAVVDPTMEGKVKITVIATGFDRLRTAQSPAAESVRPTPTDLSSYTPVRSEVDNDLLPISRSVVVSRRRSLDLPVLPAPARVDAAAPVDATDDPDASPFDVPAFLRRQGS